MSYATLMVYVDADGAPEQRVRLSADLADKFKVLLIGTSAVAFRPPMVVKGVAVQGVTEADIKQATAKLANKEKWFRGIASADNRQLEWRPLFDFPTEALAREARSADLVVIGGSAGPGDAYNSLELDGTILRIGRPTLVVPEGVSSLVAEHIVIGWKDTREARRAVQDSLPLLHEAKHVTVIEICRAGEEGAAQTQVADVARYLRRHRVEGGPRLITHQEGSVAAQLIRLAQDEGADLLVTGAYGHSRLGEWIFGDMTGDLLATSPICCLMSH
jgi:nucleotide-binding universal stress UspA family protein